MEIFLYLLAALVAIAVGGTLLIAILGILKAIGNVFSAIFHFLF